MGSRGADDALVVFDCDGVLVDTERLAIEIDREVFAEVGWSLTLDEIVERFVGRSDEYVVAEVEAYLGRPVPAGWIESNEHRYRDAFRERLAPVPGIVEALDVLALPTCVASSGSHDKMRFTLGLTGLWDRFEGRIYSASEVANGKPAPDLFLHAAERQSWMPERCLVVEDSVFGVQAGLAAGTAVIAYAGGVTPAHRFDSYDATVIHDMHDLPAAINAVR